MFCFKVVAVSLLLFGCGEPFSAQNPDLGLAGQAGESQGGDTSGEAGKTSKGGAQGGDTSEPSAGAAGSNAGSGGDDGYGEAGSVGEGAGSGGEAGSESSGGQGGEPSSAGTSGGGSSGSGGQADSAGSSGSGGFGGSGGSSGGSSVCTPSETLCDEEVFRTCDEQGSGWNEESCEFVCDDHLGCIGECAPADTRCEGNHVQTCNALGQWVTADNACPFVCVAGSCSGVCVPNQPCEDDGVECTKDICAPSGQLCLHPNQDNGFSCGGPNDSGCDNPDTCLEGACQPNIEPIHTVCRAGSCEAEVQTLEVQCDGDNPECPASEVLDCYSACDLEECEFQNIEKVTDAYSILALESDGDLSGYLYASLKLQNGTSRIVRISKADFTQEILYETIDSSKWFYAIIQAGNYVYLGETTWVGPDYSGRVLRIDTTQTLQQPTYVASHATFGFAKNSTKVWWTTARQRPCNCTSPATTYVYSVDIGGTGPTQFSRVFGDISPDIEVDDLSVYVWETLYMGAGTYSPSLASYLISNPLTVTGLVNGYFTDGASYDTYNNDTNLPGLTKTSSHVFANSGIEQSSNFVLFKISNGTTTVLTKTSPVGLTSLFVASSTHLYVGNMRVYTGGGVPQYHTPHDVMALTLDGGHVYFGSYGYWLAEPYTGGPDVPETGVYQAPL